MIMDKQAEFSDSQAVTATAISTNQYDNGGGAAVRNLGGDAGLFLVVQVDVAFAGTAGTVAISLESDSTSNLATSPTVHFNTGVIGQAALVPGTIAVIPLPFGDYERFLGIRYTVGGTVTAGSLSAFLTRTPSRVMYYPNAI